LDYRTRHGSQYQLVLRVPIGTSNSMSNDPPIRRRTTPTRTTKWL
jgi:hypothetical protein